MKIQELEKKLFGDCTKTRGTEGQYIDEFGFEFDGYMSEDAHADGDDDKVKCLITSEGEKIPLEEFILLDKDEFEAKYTSDAAKQSFKNFREKYIILSGIEILTYYRECIKAAKDKTESDTSISIEDISCGGF